MVPWVSRIGDDVRGGKLGAVDHLQARVYVFVYNYRHVLGVEEDSRDFAGGVVSLLDGLGDLVLGHGAATPRMSGDKDGDVSSVKACPVHDGFHVEAPTVAVQRGDGA